LSVDRRIQQRANGRFVDNARFVRAI